MLELFRAEGDQVDREDRLSRAVESAQPLQQRELPGGWELLDDCDEVDVAAARLEVVSDVRALRIDRDHAFLAPERPDERASDRVVVATNEPGSRAAGRTSGDSPDGRADPHRAILGGLTTVCFASWQGFPGCVTSCRHAAAVLGGVALELEDAEVPSAAIDADLLVLSAWTPGYERLLERRDGPVVGRWHSPLLQTDLSGEGWKLAHLLALLSEGQLAGLAFDDADTAAALAGPGVVHLPNVFDAGELSGVRPASLAGINVALSGEAYGRKNLLVQSAAFARARGNDWTLHLFGQTLRRSGYARWLELASVPYVEHGFLPRDEYLGLAAGMDAALCASLAESFGYAAAEFVELGVPTVVSPAVKSVEGGPLAAGDPGDVGAVAAALQRAVSARGLVDQQRAALCDGALANRRVAAAALARLSGPRSTARAR